MSMLSWQRGFSLLEMLIVLTLIAIAGSLTTPKLFKQYNRALERSQVQAYASGIERLRHQAFQQGRSVKLAKDDKGLGTWPVLPEGWSAQQLPVLRLLATGITNGGTLILQAQSGKRWQLDFAPLDGRIHIQRLGADVENNAF